MAGDIQEPFSLNFQADSWHSGSISFGRYENEALCWERRSSFTHNRYLEEVEKYSKPGSVTEKKAYFEARLKKKAPVSQSSSEWQNGTESQASENDFPENSGYEGDFEHASEVGHSARFDESHDRPTHLLENEKYRVSENDVTEVGHSARFDGSHNGDIEVTEYDREDALPSVSEHLEAEVRDQPYAGNSAFIDRVAEIEVKEKLDDQDSIMEFSSNSIDLSSNTHVTEKDGSVTSEPQRSLSSKVRTASQPRHMKSRMLSDVDVNNGKATISKKAYKDMPRKPNRRHNGASLPQKGEKPKHEVPSGSKDNLHKQQKRTEQEQRAKKVVASRAFPTPIPTPMPKVSHRVHESLNRDKQSGCSSKPVAKQNGSGFCFKSEERAERRKEFFIKLEEKMHAKETETHRQQARTQEKKAAEIKQLRRSLNFKATPMPAFYHEPGQWSERNMDLASKSKSRKSQSRVSCTSATENSCSTSEHLNVADLSDISIPASKTWRQTGSSKTVGPKREQVVNCQRQRASEKTKVGGRRMGNTASRKDIRGIDLGKSSRMGRLAVGVAS